MKLPNLPLFGKKETSEYFLVLLLRTEKATAVIIEQIDGKVRVIGSHEEYFSTSLEKAADDEWLDILDRTISRSEETLPPNIETHKTVFGVKESWIEDKKIKKEYLTKLKKVCDALDLSPIGFLVVSEAIIHLMQEEEGAPVSAILTEIGKKQVTISLVRAGKIVDTQTATVEESSVQTVDTLLKHFEDVEVLPSRIVVLNGEKDEELAQEFISHQWSKSLPFLHVPQISILPVGFDAKAVVFGAASQMGVEIMGPLGQLSAEEIKTYSARELEGKEKRHTKEKKELDKEEETREKTVKTQDPEYKKRGDEEEKETDSEHQSEAFGFFQGVDVAEKKDGKTDALHEEKQETTSRHKKVHQALEYHGEENVHHELKINRHHTFVEDHDNISEPYFQDEKRHSSIFSLLASINPRNLPFPSLPGRFYLAIIGVLLLLIGILYLYVTKLSATVTLDVKPKVLEQTETVTFSSVEDNDFSKNIISVETVSVSLDGTANIAATGKKDVGTRAKGTVTLYNSDDTKKTISEGTVITSSNNLDYTTDKDVTVASASGDIFSGIKSGTAQVAVTAKNIGQEYNLPSNTKFTIAQNSSLAAKNDSAFSGGSKKTITVVDKKDIDKLEKELPKNLEAKAKSEIAKKIVSSEERLLPDFSDITLSKKSFNSTVGDEAKTVTLKGTVTFTGASYSDTDLIRFAQESLKNRFTDDLRIARNGIKTNVENLKNDGKEIKADVFITASLLPKINIDDLKENLAGKSFEEASEVLMKLPQVSNAKIVLSPPIPFLPHMLPRVSKNITVSVKANE